MVTSKSRWTTSAVEPVSTLPRTCALGLLNAMLRRATSQRTSGRDLWSAALVQAVGPALDALFVGELKRRGRLEPLLREFVARRRFLRERGWMNPTLGDCGLDQEALDAWCRDRFHTLSYSSVAGLEGQTGFETRREYLSEVLSQYLWEHDGRSCESSARGVR